MPAFDAAGGGSNLRRVSARRPNPSRRIAWASWGAAIGLALGTIVAFATGVAVATAVGALVGVLVAIAVNRLRGG